MIDTELFQPASPQGTRRLSRFNTCPDWITFHEDLSAGAVRLYLILDSYALNKNWCFPSKTTLAVDLGVSATTVNKYLGELLDAGAICVEHVYVDIDHKSPTNGGRFVGPATLPEGTTGLRQLSNRYVLAADTPVFDAPLEEPEGYSQLPRGVQPADPPPTASCTLRRPTEENPEKKTITNSSAKAVSNETPKLFTDSTANAAVDEKTSDQKERGFKEFWGQFPRRDGRLRDKKGTLKAWCKLDLETKREIYRATQRYKKELEHNGLNACDPLRFVNKVWLDYTDEVELETKPEQPATKQVSPYAAPAMSDDDLRQLVEQSIDGTWEEWQEWRQATGRSDRSTITGEDFLAFQQRKQ